MKPFLIFIFSLFLDTLSKAGTLNPEQVSILATQRSMLMTVCSSDSADKIL
uniref:Uncharacterized protein n=1 Tax=Lepeophtheirus salmonis TaxID=72036 RepID=A0A0K2ULW3_LEPSM